MPSPWRKNSGDVGQAADLSKEEGARKQEVGNEGREVEEMDEGKLRETSESGMQRREMGEVETSGDLIGTFEMRKSGKAGETVEVKGTGEVEKSDEEKTKEIEAEGVFEALCGMNVKTGGGFSCVGSQTEDVESGKLLCRKDAVKESKLCQVRCEGKVVNSG